MKIEDQIREAVYDWLSEDEKYYGKMDDTESITEPVERFIKDLQRIFESFRFKEYAKEMYELIKAGQSQKEER